MQPSNTMDENVINFSAGLVCSFLKKYEDFGFDIFKKGQTQSNTVYIYYIFSIYLWLMAI